MTDFLRIVTLVALRAFLTLSPRRPCLPRLLINDQFPTITGDDARIVAPGDVRMAIK